jgi:hypothetical protein
MSAVLSASSSMHAAVVAARDDVTALGHDGANRQPTFVVGLGCLLERLPHQMPIRIIGFRMFRGGPGLFFAFRHSDGVATEYAAIYSNPQRWSLRCESQAETPAALPPSQPVFAHVVRELAA